MAVQERELTALLRLADSVHEECRPTGSLYQVTVDVTAIAAEVTELSGFVAHVGGAGRVDAAISAMQLLATVSPRWLFLVGVAGGFGGNGVALGDILVAEQVVDYELQRVADSGDEYRLRTYKADALLVAAGKTADGTNWRSRIAGNSPSSPNVHFGSVFSGDKVVASAQTVATLMRLSPKALGVEMEGAGVAAAVRRQPRYIGFLMIRGVVDLANSRKRADAELWTGQACDAVAAFTIGTAACAIAADVQPLDREGHV